MKFMAVAYPKMPRNSNPHSRTRGQQREDDAEQNRSGNSGLVAVLEQENREKSPSFAGVPDRKWVAVAGALAGCRGGTEQIWDFQQRGGGFLGSRTRKERENPKLGHQFFSK
ncbi:hypothetical protein SLEP1_g24706 [Rubroshorea leprosula]|uniref:Uncharacterized protein n=1 Tax=Rubroshorea leprosula TaxID=152421 RepID=A0AAV5JTR9_9ROSI|nr:hypothetical protein SLEP1_g24706 [Rubroshorea leprosula]